ncbi:uncharacterized protein LOC120253818 [Dioscorea cayenensis subsp. rotundata]|uniref:Uncharacterized protein LOC120253818 n=1 Tax=Dioscorea cayennensis subsp. rotundata TaxID=55577 RepID=A0AB40ASY7_DIOCR|nr:uncharacterized protein LOC120253818 [Dioscorea cayenensis subsp. rotundata]
MAQSDGGEDAGKSSRSPSHSSNSRDGDEGARFHPFRRPKTPFSQALMAQSDGGEAAGKSSRTPSHCPTLEMAMKVPASTLIAALKPPLLKGYFRTNFQFSWSVWDADNPDQQLLDKLYVGSFHYHI